MQITGRLGADPEIRTLKDGRKVARFSIAVNDSYTNAFGALIKDVQWHPVVAWNGLAAQVQKNLGKGSPVVIEGRMVKRTFINKEGEKRYILEIVADEFSLNYQKAA